jgi:hypothetical protein
MGYLSVFGGIFSPKDSERLNNLNLEFEVGDVVMVKVIKQKESTENGFKNYELRLASVIDYEIKIGEMVTARVLKVNKSDLRV